MGVRFQEFIRKIETDFGFGCFAYGFHLIGGNNGGVVAECIPHIGQHGGPDHPPEVLLSRLHQNAEAYGAVLRIFADPDNLPAIYHCSAGKDRTGIITAYLYALLGVPNEIIIADYSLSNLGFDHYCMEFIASGRIDRLSLDPDEFRSLFMVDPAWMKNLLTYIGANYGSMQNYLIQKAGLDQLTLDRIRENILE